jgi:hypothetical protein
MYCAEHSINLHRRSIMDSPYAHLVVVHREEVIAKNFEWYHTQDIFAGRPWVVYNRDTNCYISPAFLTKEDCIDERAEIIAQDMCSDYDDGLYYPD